MTQQEFERTCPTPQSTTLAKWVGDEPACQGLRHVEGGFCDEWCCYLGGGTTYKGQLIVGTVFYSYNRSIFIDNDTLNAVEILMGGVNEFAIGAHSICGLVRPERWRAMPRERVLKWLSLDMEGEFYQIFRKRAYEILEAST